MAVQCVLGGAAPAVLATGLAHVPAQGIPVAAPAPDPAGYGYIDSRAPGRPGYNWLPDVREGTILALQGDDVVSPVIAAPFDIILYGHAYDSFWVNSNGVIGFGQASREYTNRALPARSLGGAAIAAYWDDLYPTSARRIAYQVYGNAPTRLLAVEWQSDVYYRDTRMYPTIQALVYEDGRIVFQYDPGVTAIDRGSATIGIQDETATIATQYSFAMRAVLEPVAIQFSRPENTAPPVRTSAVAPEPIAALPACQNAVVVGGFRKLLEINTSVRTRIGCPEGPENPIEAAEQYFQSGHMLWRSDTRQITVSFADDTWIALADLFTGEPEAEERAPEGLVAPIAGFGKLWREHPGLRERLGWALAPERGFHGATEAFAGGSLLWSGEETWLLRVYFADGGTLVTPDPNRPRP